MKPITDHPFSPNLLTSPEYFWNCKTPAELHAYYLKLGKRKDDDLQQLLAIAQNERKLLTLIRSTVLTMDGWCSDVKACVLSALVMAIRPKQIIEIGVFAGRSLLPMAITAKGINLATKIIGIDPYSPQESAKNETPENSKWWGQLDHNLILEKLQHNMKQCGVTELVQLVRTVSDSYTPAFGIDMIHIDGSHTEQAVRDAERYGPAVRVGGIMVCDDVSWAGGAVLRAIDTLEQQGFVEALRVEDWNVMQKVK